MSREPNDKEGWRAWHTIVRLPEFPLRRESTALIVIDITYQQASRDYGNCRRIIEAGNGDDLQYFLGRMENTVMPALGRLIGGFRTLGAPVIYTRCASLRGDGSDQTWRHRAFGLAIDADEHEAQIMDEIAPQPGDITLVKTGSSTFTSTNCEHLLHVMGITTLVVTGIYTNSCVEGTIRVGGDLDFRCVMAEDACAAMSPSGHANAIEYLDGNFCHVKSSDEILGLMRKDSAAA
ncbi:MAG: isochorismatase family cysteine hydrolase [Alphaproteobacteria bacterium]|jgi:nicotinamidase-related amidase|nr:isochorismatase family cysteine hydrolase [Alphaproteobacteria bacterium]MDP6591221.1 isochorismatase family cysteine hydrolase [Alphaproteobacteria bacterium]MDP6817764.1 isochorismatase family cysteine hydrolase [Alphaproteobacteria bacterium]